MKKFKKMLPYLIINAIVFYLTPFMIKDTGSGMLQEGERRTEKIKY